MNGAFEAMSEAIHRYEGTIAKLVGDAVLAFFGAPIAHEDDPERAVRAALDMLERRRGVFGRRSRTEHGLDFAIRIGINTGPGHGRQRRQRPALRVHGARRRRERGRADAERRSTGDRARSPTRRTASSRTPVDVSDLGLDRGQGQVRARPRLRGRRACAPAGLGPRPRRAREPDGRARTSTFAAPRASCWPTSRAGRGRAAVIVGEPGIGKSRLLAELRSAARRARRDTGSRDAACPSVSRCRITCSSTSRDRSSACAPRPKSPRFAPRSAADSRTAPGRRHGRPCTAFLGHLLAIPLEPAAQRGR